MLEPEPEDPELLLEDFELLVLALAAGAAAGVAAAGAAAGALDEDVEPDAPLLASLFTPPCPRQAPRPLFVEVVPSLHIVVPEPEEEDPEDPDEEPLPEELLDEPEAGALLLEELPPAPALAVLSTPPCPRHAPRPLLVAVVPSLQTGLAVLLVLLLEVLLPVLCASDSAGAASSAAANTAPHVKPLNFARFMDRSPLKEAVILRAFRIP